jgi:hypothetical protein
MSVATTIATAVGDTVKGLFSRRDALPPLDGDEDWIRKLRRRYESPP